MHRRLWVMAGLIRERIAGNTDAPACNLIPELGLNRQSQKLAARLDKKRTLAMVTQLFCLVRLTYPFKLC